VRFLQLVFASGPRPSAPDPAHFARLKASIDAAIASGETLATCPLGKRATAAARIIQQNGEIRIEDPPDGDGWLAAGGYSLLEYASKAEAIAKATEKFAMLGDGVIELIQVSEMYPPPNRPPPAPGAPVTAGVIPYLTMEDASAASAFYQLAFGAREVARLAADDGKRLMHCHLEINGGALMLSDNFVEYGAAPLQRSPSYTMQLVVTDGDAWWNRALRAGCTEKMPFSVAPWGDKYGQLADPFGVLWAINAPAKP